MNNDIIIDTILLSQDIIYYIIVYPMNYDCVWDRPCPSVHFYNVLRLRERERRRETECNLS